MVSNMLSSRTPLLINTGMRESVYVRSWRGRDNLEYGQRISLSNLSVSKYSESRLIILPSTTT